MALLLKAEEIEGLISIEEAINAVESGFRDQANHPRFSLSRQRMMAAGLWLLIWNLFVVPMALIGLLFGKEWSRARDQGSALRS